MKIRLNHIVVREEEDEQEAREYAYGLATQAAHKYLSDHKCLEGLAQAKRLLDGAESVHIGAKYSVSVSRS